MATIQEIIDNPKWSRFNDEIIKQKVYWLGDLRSSTNVHYHGAEIFAYRQTYYSTSFTQYEIKISAGAYGETGGSVSLPIGTKLKDAKAKLLELVKLNEEYFDKDYYN